ncbi:MAG: hypothetical protein V4436_00130 [Patescibacteria group bacterium]
MNSDLVYGLVDPNEEPMFMGAYELLGKKYGLDQLDSVATTKASMLGKRASGEQAEITQRFAVAYNQESNEILFVVGGGVSKLAHGGMALLLTYFAVREGYEAIEPVLALQTLHRLVTQAKLEAGAAKKELVAVSIEDKDSEALLNSLGLLRPRVLGEDGIHFEPLYEQPPLSYDPTTGLPSDGATGIPLHLTIGLLTENRINLAEKWIVSDIVWAMYAWSHLKLKKFFSNRNAYLAHLQYIAAFKKRYDEQLFAGKEIRFFTAEQRFVLSTDGSTEREAASA